MGRRKSLPDPYRRTRADLGDRYESQAHEIRQDKRLNLNLKYYAFRL